MAFQPTWCIEWYIGLTAHRLRAFRSRPCEKASFTSIHFKTLIVQGFPVNHNSTRTHLRWRLDSALTDLLGIPNQLVKGDLGRVCAILLPCEFSGGQNPS
jgi:hypothetical protein